MTGVMRAVVVDAPGPPEVLRQRLVPIPDPAQGEVLIRVRAFGLNRSELHFRRGQATSGSFPRIPGIEAVGTVEDAPGGEFEAGAQVATMMGGMGREFDGGYAEYVRVPAGQVIGFTSSLPWATLGAVPEMLQTAAGSLDVGVRARPGESLLIRGGGGPPRSAWPWPCWRSCVACGCWPPPATPARPGGCAGWGSTT